MPIDYNNYPPNWKTEIRPRILQRAGNFCEFCGVENYSIRQGTRIVLTIAHLDQDITHNDDSNLAALCQRCHLRHDQQAHRQHFYQNRQRRQERHGQQRLFTQED